MCKYTSASTYVLYKYVIRVYKYMYIHVVCTCTCVRSSLLHVHTCLYPVLSSDEDTELLGHLTVSVCALDVLQHLS